MNQNHPIKQLYFYLTEGCNLACRHCWLNPKHQTADKSYGSLDLELLKTIVQEGVQIDLKGVKLTGGEPLMHPQIHDILDFLATTELSVDIETNGILVTPEIAKKFADFKRKFVAISLDGATADTHQHIRGVDGCFDDTIQGIKHFVDAGIRPQVIMSVMQSNKHQIEDLVKLGESLGVSSIKFNIIQPTGRGKSMTDHGDTLTIQEHLDTAGWIINELQPTTKIKLTYHLPPAFIPLNKMFSSQNGGCVICGIFGILGVLANGAYALCGIGNHIQELVFGQAGQDKLEDVWNDNPTLNAIREGLPSRLTGVCGACMMKKSCLASCIAQNYHDGHDLWSPFWFCREAHEQGLFPHSRLTKDIS